MQKRLQEWDEHFKANDAEGLSKLYSEDAVVLDNQNQPRKGQKCKLFTSFKLIV